MNTYYLRFTEDMRDQLVALGVQLGVIALVAPPDLRPQQPAPTPAKSRSRAAPLVQAVPLRVVALHGGTWDELGYIPDDRTGTEVPDPLTPDRTMRVDMQPRQQDGKRLWHVNLRTPVNLRERAMEVAKSNPAIAAELAQLRRYFVTRPGRPDIAAVPQTPARVFA